MSLFRLLFVSLLISSSVQAQTELQSILEDKKSLEVIDNRLYDDLIKACPNPQAICYTHSLDSDLVYLNSRIERLNNNSLFKKRYGQFVSKALNRKFIGYELDKGSYWRAREISTNQATNAWDSLPTRKSSEAENKELKNLVEANNTVKTNNPYAGTSSALSPERIAEQGHLFDQTGGGGLLNDLTNTLSTLAGVATTGRVVQGAQSQVSADETWRPVTHSTTDGCKYIAHENSDWMFENLILHSANCVNGYLDGGVTIQNRSKSVQEAYTKFKGRMNHGILNGNVEQRYYSDNGEKTSSLNFIGGCATTNPTCIRVDDSNIFNNSSSGHSSTSSNTPLPSSSRTSGAVSSSNGNNCEARLASQEREFEAVNRRPLPAGSTPPLMRVMWMTSERIKLIKAHCSNSSEYSKMIEELQAAYKQSETACGQIMAGNVCPGPNAY